MSYQASGTIKCWKKYDCLGCGAVFRHRFERSVSGQGGTAEQAEANAQQAGVAALQNQVDVIPCPECGRVQPRMVGHSKNGGHFTLTAACLIAAVVVVLLGATDVFTRDVSALALAGLAALGAVGHFLIAKSDPNGRAEANKEATGRKVQSGSVEVIRPGDPANGEPPPPLVTGGHVVYFGLAVFAVLLALVPVGVRVLNGWTLSKTDPPVMGPGDTFRIEFPDKIDCVRSTWAGTPAIAFDGPAPANVRVASSTDTWGMSMSVKSSEMHTSPTLWADVTLPADDALANKELSGRVTMQVRFPQAMGANGMQTRETTVAKPFKVTLATVNAWKTFRTAWWVGALSSVLTAALAGWGFARLAARMKWNSPPDLVESLDTPAADLPPEELERLRNEARAQEEQQQPEPPARKPWER